MKIGYQKGRSAQINTNNKFLSNEYVAEHIEGIDESSTPYNTTSIYFENTKNIISENKSPDVPFRYSINPYQGCEHGCVYCYARNTHSYWGFSAGMDWESKIIVKKEAAKLLEKVFLKKSWQPDTIMLSGNTDPYQPLEKKLKLTQSLLHVFAKYHNPVGIITKNSLIARDQEILKYLAGKRLVRIYFSITTLDEKLRRKMEPRTANATKMMQTMQLLVKSGIDVGVMIGPIIPSVNDREIDNILRVSSEHGASMASYTLARFNGDVGSIFKDWLKRNFQDRSEKVWNKVANMHGGQVNDSRFGVRMKGEGNYAELLRSIFDTSKKKYFQDQAPEPLRNDLFRVNGNLNLFN